MMPLEGIRVVDLSRYAPGPYGTMLLADLGADVVVESFRPGVAKRLSVDYGTLSRRTPRLIYCSVTGYGQTGPYAQHAGHDLNYISLAGVLGMVGWPGQPPAIPVNIIADFAGGGLFAAFAILAAVVARQTTGRGQFIDMAMTDGALSLACLAVGDYLSSGTPPRPGRYYVNGQLPCYHVYEAADGKWLSVGAMEPWLWKRFCAALGCEQYAAEQFNLDKAPEVFSFLRRRPIGHISCEFDGTREYRKLPMRACDGAAAAYRGDAEDRKRGQRGA